MLLARRFWALVGVSALAVSAAQAQTGPTNSAGTVLPPVTVAPSAASRGAVRPASAERRAPASQRPAGRVSERRTPTVSPAAVPTLPPNPLDEFSVTNTKTETPVIDSLGGTSVISQQQIQQTQPDRVSDILRQIPGVSTQEISNNPGQAINIRGMQDFGRVNVLVDGARQNFQSTGHGPNGTFFLDPELIGGVDVTRGPVSTIYGSGAIGGVVSFRTRGIDDILKPEETAGFEQRIGAGTNGYGIVSSTAGGFRLPDNAANVFGQFVLRDGYNYKDGAGLIISDTGKELRAGNIKVNINPAEGHQISATALIQSFDFTNNGSAITGARFRNELDTSTYTLGYRYTPPDMPLIDFNVKGYYSTTDSLQTLLSPTRTYTAIGARPGGQIKVDLETTGFDVFNTSRFDTGPISHTLTIGGDGVFDHVRTRDNAGGFTGAFTPSGERSLLGAFVQDEMRYGGWLRAVAAVRYDSYELKGGAYKSEGDRVSPRGTIGVSPFPWIEFFGTYAEGYRAPAISETLISGTHPFPAFNILPNPGLRPETAHNWEGGINIKFDDVLKEGDKFRGKVVAYQNTIDNYIGMQGVGPYYSVPVAPGFPAFLCPIVPNAPCAPMQSQQFVNIAKARISGVEVEGAYDWGTGFVSAMYSHVEGKNKATHETLTTIPPDRVGGTFGLRFLDNRLTVGTRVTYYDARRSINTTFPSTKEYALVDLFASYQYNDWIRGDVVLANIGDVRYTRYLDALASPGFQARGALTIKFATR
ncbi:TonB-dependent hemoglobin/transferrin/lactoferrin family receptor [Enterovirga rhinocerotis]|uniref:Hemoglobin/transferrin/lactoferrin receptor protein n=1 Tax=Enterovirga rhinocerotis TaxID=1339210 RepID=A0A4R7BV40_9HYPH|nr:TonB-dependent hemoglobin/transferrin/lactoferrin family receptor [Enterovirga rhinocerotis]TDR89263.1 hemoglobin/transferrin/lactoferrin receptor protein [Enterovirga rhinocerotis]